jgi:hypothetical protein
MNDRLLPEIEAAAYRIVQEALTNVAKHAQATACRVDLQRLPNALLITIEDDGIGFDLIGAEQAGVRRGLGLIGIRERVSQLQGGVRLESAPGKGTRVTVKLPARSRTSVPDVDGIEPSAASISSLLDPRKPARYRLDLSPGAFDSPTQVCLVPGPVFELPQGEASRRNYQLLKRYKAVYFIYM